MYLLTFHFSLPPIFKLPVDTSQMDDGIEMKSSEVLRITSPNLEYTNATHGLPNHANISTKMNFHSEEVFYYQSQDMAHNYITEKILVMKNPPSQQLCGYASKHQPHVDCNNNQPMSPYIELSLPSPAICQDRMMPPLVNPHFQSPQHVTHMNWKL